MIQPYVLPSNASPLVGGSEAAPRVLQEHSGNRQHDFKFSQDYELKSSGSLLSENIHPRLPVRPQPVYRQHALSHTPYRSGFARPNYGRMHHPTQAEKDERARILLRRFHSSEQYAKYRSRQTKTDGKDGDQKWPDHLEQAFFRGMYFSAFESVPLTLSQLLSNTRQWDVRSTCSRRNREAATNSLLTGSRWRPVRVATANRFQAIYRC